MQMIDNIPVYGTSIDEGALAQIKTCARSRAGPRRQLSEDLPWPCRSSYSRLIATSSRRRVVITFVLIE
jgi:hypothetical protein